jgi:hypothetical protein
MKKARPYLIALGLLLHCIGAFAGPLDNWH